MQEIIILAIVYYTSTLIVEQMVRLFGEFLDQSDEIGLIVYIFEFILMTYWINLCWWIDYFHQNDFTFNSE